MKFSFVIILAVSLIGLSSVHASDDELPSVQVLTQSTPPYSSVVKGSPLNEGASVVGPAADIVKAYLTEHKLDYKIHVTEWSAAFRRAKQRSLTLIYPLDRTPSREDDFIWLMPVITQSYYIYVRDEPKFTSLTLDDLITGDFITTCNQDSVLCRLIEEIGIPADRITYSNHTTLPIVHNLISNGQSDFSIFNDKVYDALAVKYKFDKKLKRMFKVDEKTSYLAAGKNLDPRILNALQQK